MEFKLIDYSISTDYKIKNIILLLAKIFGYMSCEALIDINRNKEYITFPLAETFG